MREVFIKVVSLLVGNHELADIWAGFIASVVSSVIILRALIGKDFTKQIRLYDIIYWFIGVFVTMRIGMFLIIKIDYLKNYADLDSVAMGLISGVINSLLYQSDYKFLKDNLFKYLKKYGVEIDEKSSIIKTIDANEKINNLLLELQTKLQSEPVIAIAEITNGGAVPKVGKALYIRALYSTSEDSLILWGEKTLVMPNVLRAINEVNINGNAIIDIPKFEDNKVDVWADKQQVKRVVYYLIGYDSNSRCLILSINLKEKLDLTEDEKYEVVTTCTNLKNELNKARKFYEKKIS